MLLRVRYIAAALVLFVVVMGGAFYAFDIATVDLEEVVESAMQRKRPVDDLIVDIDQVRLDGHYMAFSGKKYEMDLFRTRLEDLEGSFEEALSSKGLVEEEARRIRKAQKLWRTSSRQLIDEVGPEFHLDAVVKFDGDVSLAITFLEQVRQLVQEELDQNIALAYATRSQLRIRMLVTIAIVFGLVLFLSLFMLSRTRRAIRLHVRDIAEGAERIGEGDFSHRIFVGERDALGEVAACFNEMADHLERHSKLFVEMSMRDEVTGLYNRGEFLRVLRSERERGRRYKRPFSIMVIRFNNWAEVIEKYGRDVANAALREVATMLRKTSRETDRLGRWNENEFGVVMTEVGLEGAKVASRRVRERVASFDLRDQAGNPITFSVQIGEAEYVQDMSTEESLVEAAEEALQG